MKVFIKVISIVLVCVVVSGGALVVGYQFGKITRGEDHSASLSGENRQSQVLPDQQAAQISDDALVLYSMNCAGCHGASGEGSAIAPALDHPDLRTRLDDTEIKATIEHGRPGTAMPAWKNRLTDSQINSLTALIRNWGELDAGQLSQLESQTQSWHGMRNWQENQQMIGDGCNPGMRGRGWRRSP